MREAPLSRAAHSTDQGHTEGHDKRVRAEKSGKSFANQAALATCGEGSLGVAEQKRCGRTAGLVAWRRLGTWCVQESEGASSWPERKVTSGGVDCRGGRAGERGSCGMGAC